ncbi:MAG: DNA-binding NarL/FixJ family response regulator [Arenicella sp.]|jgi:DNA-binding NarL/FixJ family response regulator
MLINSRAICLSLKLFTVFLAQVANDATTNYARCYPRNYHHLTIKESEILRLVASGYSNKEISQALNKSEGTIKNHVSNILSKLGVRDRTRAVLRAIEAGLI